MDIIERIKMNRAYSLNGLSTGFGILSIVLFWFYRMTGTVGELLSSLGHPSFLKFAFVISLLGALTLELLIRRRKQDKVVFPTSAVFAFSVLSAMMLATRVDEITLAPDTF